MKSRLLELINSRGVLFDGAMGTELIARGLPAGQPPEEWNLKHPEIIEQIHRAYFEAGADIVQTNTFGGNRLKLATRGMDNLVGEVNIQGAKIALAVKPAGGFVAGNIGPTGKFLQPVGRFTPAELEEVFYEQASLLVEGKVELINIETMYDLEEAKAAVRGSRRATDLPVFASMTFSRTKKGFYTIMGNDVPTSLKELEGCGAEVVGANCTIGMPEMVELVRLMREDTDLPIIAQANAGAPQMRDGKVTYPLSAEEYASYTEELLEAGADIIGGCCGAGPEYIRLMAPLVKREKPWRKPD